MEMRERAPGFAAVESSPGNTVRALHRRDLPQGIIRRLGALDERFESYLEDIDFGIRCATAGLTGIYVPEAVLIIPAAPRSDAGILQQFVRLPVTNCF